MPNESTIKIVRGCKHLNLFTILENTPTSFKTDVSTWIEGLQSVGFSEENDEIKIPGDDGYVYQGKNLKSVTVTFKMAGIALKNLALVTGSAFDPTKNKMSEKDPQNAPEFLAKWISPLADGGFRGTLYYVGKLMSYAYTETTLPNNTEGTPIDLVFSFTKALIGGDIRDYQDFAKDDNGFNTFLSEIVQLPEQSAGGGGTGQ